MSRKIIISEYIEDILPEISDADAGWILRAVFAMNGGKDPGEPPEAIRIAWKGIRRQQAAMIAKYEETCAKRAAVGRAGIEKRWSGGPPKPIANAIEEIANDSNCLQKIAIAIKEGEKEEEKERDIPRIPKPNPKPDAGAREYAAAEPPQDLGPPPPAPDEGDALSAFSDSVSAFSVSAFSVSADLSSNFFAMPESSLIPAALRLVGEDSSAFMRNVLRRRMRQIGVAEFRDLLNTYAAELAAGEIPDNRGRCLNARLSARVAICNLAAASTPDSTTSATENQEHTPAEQQ